MPVRLSQLSNALSPMVVNWLPPAKVTLVRLLQPQNAKLPIEVTLSGMVILVRLLQSTNAALPMIVN